MSTLGTYRRCQISDDAASNRLYLNVHQRLGRFQCFVEKTAKELQFLVHEAHFKLNRQQGGRRELVFVLLHLVDLLGQTF